MDHVENEGWEAGWSEVEARITAYHIDLGTPWEEHVEVLRDAFLEYCWNWNMENVPGFAEEWGDQMP